MKRFEMTRRAARESSTPTSCDLPSEREVLEGVRTAAGGYQGTGTRGVSTVCSESGAPKPAVQEGSCRAGCLLSSSDARFPGGGSDAGRRDRLVLDREP